MVTVRRESVGPAGSSPTVSVKLRCTACGKARSHQLSNVTLHVPRPSEKADGIEIPEDWDGLFTTTVVRCACGSVDQYELTSEARMRLMGRVLAAAFDPAARDVRLGLPALWDGSVPRRPTEALDHLRTLAETMGSGEAWRRLGNFQEQVGDRNSAAASWLRAAEDPAEVEALVSLAAAAYEDHQDDVALTMAERCLERACRGGTPLLAEPLLRTATSLLLEVSEGRSMDAAWRASAVRGDPVVHLSTLRLNRVPHGARLAEFFLEAEPFALRFGPDGLDPDEPQTQLERWIEDDEVPVVPASVHTRPPSRAPDKDRKKKRKAERKARKANRRR